MLMRGENISPELIIPLVNPGGNKSFIIDIPSVLQKRMHTIVHMQESVQFQSERLRKIRIFINPVVVIRLIGLCDFTHDILMKSPVLTAIFFMAIL